MSIDLTSIVQKWCPLAVFHPQVRLVAVPCIWTRCLVGACPVGLLQPRLRFDNELSAGALLPVHAGMVCGAVQAHPVLGRW